MRVKSGIFNLDKLLGGGFVPNSVAVILGSTGTGKTIFALQYLLKGLEDGEKCIFISFDVDEREVLKIANSLGWDVLAKYVEEEKLLIRKFLLEETTCLIEDMLNFVGKVGDVGRIVIDSFSPLVAEVSYRARNALNLFFLKLRNMGTAVITLEEPPSGNLDAPSITLPIFLSDTLIHLKNIGYGEAFNRTLRIVKHRGSWHAEGIFPFRILKGIGIFVEAPENFKKLGERRLEEVLQECNVSYETLPENLRYKVEKLMENRISKEEAKKILESVLQNV